MKHLLPFALILLIISCNNEPKLDIVGAYSMETQVLNDGSKDSSIDRKQLKIYTTDNYFMYASPNVADSFANFGIGRYEIKGDKLYEYRFYTAEGGEKSDTFVVSVTKGINGYSQVIENINLSGKNYKLSESYTSASNETKTPLDGAWKQVRAVYITKAGDSSVNNPLEYKIYQSGYFIWAITVEDSAKNRKSVFGYGPFKMVDSTKIKETVANSTFISGLLGKTYEVDIEFPSPDTYKQIITFANGDRSIEVYQRLK